MPQLDDEIFAPGAFKIYIAPVGTARPADPRAPGAEWKDVGHTDIESILETEVEGGEAKELGSAQKSIIRTTYSPFTEAYAVKLIQFSRETFRLYYGANATSDDQGNLRPNASNPTPTKGAFLAVLIDGSRVLTKYAPLAEYFRSGEPVSYPALAELGFIPISVKPLVYNTNDWSVDTSTIGPAYIKPTGATASSAGGSFTPAGAEAPASLVDIQARGALGSTTAHPAGNYVLLLDGSKARWTGTAWAAF